MVRQADTTTILNLYSTLNTGQTTQFIKMTLLLMCFRTCSLIQLHFVSNSCIILFVNQ